MWSTVQYRKCSVAWLLTRTLPTLKVLWNDTFVFLKNCLFTICILCTADETRSRKCKCAANKPRSRLSELATVHLTLSFFHLRTKSEFHFVAYAVLRRISAVNLFPNDSYWTRKSSHDALDIIHSSALTPNWKVNPGWTTTRRLQAGQVFNSVSKAGVIWQSVRIRDFARHRSLLTNESIYNWPAQVPRQWMILSKPGKQPFIDS